MSNKENIVSPMALSVKITILMGMIIIDTCCDYFSNFTGYKKGFNEDGAVNDVNETIYLASGLAANT